AGLGQRSKWARSGALMPRCDPAGTGGLTEELIESPKAAVLYENSGKRGWLQLGDLIRVGLAWRIIDAPSFSAPGGVESPASGDPETQKLMEELGKLDGNPPRDQPGPNAEVVRYNLARADILQRIVAKAKPEERDQWLRQEADCFS